jgi:hypothetical protein
MTARSENGGPAFPVEYTEAVAYARAMEDLANPNLDGSERAHLEAMVAALRGMPLRDYFAIRCLPVVASGYRRRGNDFIEVADYDVTAEGAYAMADAMLRARDA